MKSDNGVSICKLFWPRVVSASDMCSFKLQTPGIAWKCRLLRANFAPRSPSTRIITALLSHPEGEGAPMKRSALHTVKFRIKSSVVWHANIYPRGDEGALPWPLASITNARRVTVKGVANHVQQIAPVAWGWIVRKATGIGFALARGIIFEGAIMEMREIMNTLGQNEKVSYSSARGS